MKRFIFTSLSLIIAISIMAQQKITQTAGRDALGEFAPEFAHLNDDILFGEVWSRNDLLSLRDRSLVTITSLISQGITDNSLVYHLKEAKKNGITRKVAVRSRSSASVRVFIAAGTEHPNPIIMGINALPESPN